MNENNIVCSDNVCAPVGELVSSPVNESTKQMHPGEALEVEIYSDVICPWCFIGKRRFEEAVTRTGLAGRINITWRPFELNPDMPKDGMNRKDYRTRKFGTWEYAQKLDQQITEAGREEGLAFNYDVVKKTPNTFNSHRLTWFAQKNGRQDQVVEALFKAYFSDGADIGDVEVLTKLGADAGLDAAELKEFLNSSEAVNQVKEEEVTGIRLGVNGVPAFVINGELAFSGAQDPGVVAEVLTELVKQKAAASR